MKANTLAWVAATICSLNQAACVTCEDCEGETGGAYGGAPSTSWEGGFGGASTTTTDTTSSTSTSDEPGDTFESAAQLVPGARMEALDPTGDIDFFSFEGQAGQGLYAAIRAEWLDYANLDPTYIDTVLTLFDASLTPIAANNDTPEDGTHDARLLTILPAAETYYLRVAECWTVMADPAASCRGVSDKLHTDYELDFDLLDPGAQGDKLVEIEGGDDAASAAPLTYEKSVHNQYLHLSLYGTFRDEGDIDVYSFTIPAEVGSGGPARGMFFFDPPGVTGDGSTSSIGSAWITSASDPGAVIARIDGTKATDLLPPLDVEVVYLLFVEHPASASGAFDFYTAFSYLFSHYGFYGGLETEYNDDLITADELAFGGFPEEAVYFIQGDLLPAATDVDYSFAEFVSGLGPEARLHAICSAQRNGSGLRGLTVSLFTPDGAPIPDATATETEDQSAEFEIHLPADVTKVLLRVEAAWQDPEVSSTYYYCQLWVYP